ncbi:hypothetical protein KKF91_12840 [Myxococcota bacterium]|nr:hypothetical protein [Myxococcota bacterium]MBU1431421.1 hypothetical protein [Myxococcota bacterium]
MMFLALSFVVVAACERDEGEEAEGADATSPESVTFPCGPHACAADQICEREYGEGAHSIDSSEGSPEDHFACVAAPESCDGVPICECLSCECSTSPEGFVTCAYARPSAPPQGG